MYPAVTRSTGFILRPAARHSFSGNLRVPLILLTILCALMVNTSGSSRVHAQSEPDISGSWRGTLVVGQMDPFDIVFHILGDAGNYAATLDIPSQSRIGLPVDSVRVTGSNITMRMDSLQAEYYATLVMEDDDSAVIALNGDWGQSGEHIPLRMQRDSL